MKSTGGMSVDEFLSGFRQTQDGKRILGQMEDVKTRELQQAETRCRDWESKYFRLCEGEHRKQPDMDLYHLRMGMVDHDAWLSTAAKWYRPLVDKLRRLNNEQAVVKELRQYLDDADAVWSDPLSGLPAERRRGESAGKARKLIADARHWLSEAVLAVNVVAECTARLADLREQLAQLVEASAHERREPMLWGRFAGYVVNN